MLEWLVAVSLLLLLLLLLQQQPRLCRRPLGCGPSEREHHRLCIPAAAAKRDSNKRHLAAIYRLGCVLASSEPR